MIWALLAAWAVDPATCKGETLDACVAEAQKILETTRDTTQLAAAAKAFDAACTAKRAEACISLASMYTDAIGVPRDPVEASKRYELACQASAAQCFHIGTRMIQGRGVEADIPGGLAHVRRSCEAGELDGCLTLATLLSGHEHVPPHPRRASAAESRACDLGDMRSCMAHGKRLLEGDGVEKNLAVAILSLDKACLGGRSGACRMLGEHFRPVNAEEARRYFGKACTIGLKSACDSAASIPGQ